MYAEIKPAMKRNEAVLNDLPGELYTIKANDKIPNYCRYPLALIQAVQNIQTNTGGLANLFKIKIGAKLMLTVNIYKQDRLINGQTGSISHIEFAQGSVCKIFEKFSDEQAGLRVTRSSYLYRQNSWVPFKKCESEIPIKRALHLHPSSELNFL